MQILLIFPHQLFQSNADLARKVERIYLLEEPLFFLQYRFHQQKLVLHRASMRSHAVYLREQGCSVEYLDFSSCAGMDELFELFATSGVDEVHYIDVVDDWLEQRLKSAGALHRIALKIHKTPMFLTEDRLLDAHFSARKFSKMSSFYVDQRRQEKILIDADGPAGGRWSFDEDNRKKLPKGYAVPSHRNPSPNRFVKEAQEYVEINFKGNPGSVDPFFYPVTYADARQWLDDFLTHRLHDFGSYEDAISQHHDILFHSVLTPLLNIGLLTPRQVVEAALAHRHRVPMNSLEGFIRQVIGWREYMRGVYLSKGRQQRTRNFWNHTRAIPAAFWTGSTLIDPIDTVIDKLLRTGYAHHIERLMVLSNFMLLCEFDPDQVYRWFMEMFIDSYDWVMVPNVYGMALYSGGAGITTKPYLSASNYLLKMSDFKRGPWCEIWDGLYWRFVAKHRQVFTANHRTQYTVLGLDRMGPAKLALHVETAERFLRTLSEGAVSGRQGAG